MPQAMLSHRGIIYTQVDNGNLLTPDFYHLRVEANRDLDEDELLTFAGLAGYSWASTVRGERLGDSEADSDCSVIFFADSTKSASDDIGVAFKSFYETLSRLVSEGSPMRKTNKAGPNTKGTRLIQGIDEDLKVTLWVA